MSELLATKMKREAESYKYREPSHYSPKAIANKWEKYREERKFLKQKKICISIIEQAAKKGSKKAYVYISDNLLSFGYHIKGIKGLKGSTYLQIDDRGKADLREVLIAEGFKIDEYSPKTKFDKCWKYTSNTNNDYDLSCEIKHGPFSDWYSPDGFYHLFVWVITF